jgi:hypothetical protein
MMSDTATATAVNRVRRPRRGGGTRPARTTRHYRPEPSPAAAVRSVPNLAVNVDLRGRALLSSVDVECGIRGSIVRSPSALARHDVRGIPVRPVVLWRGRLILAVPQLCFSQELRQRRNVEAESSPGEPRLDLLEKPSIAVGVGERSVRTIGLPLRVRPGTG